jgi:hypothetical protein
MERDRNTPNQTANKGKAEGERWKSESDTVERRDHERSAERQEETGEGGGITNRPIGEEVRNQDMD